MEGTGVHWRPQTLEAPAQNQILASSRNGKLSVFRPAFSWAVNVRFPLCLNCCLACSVPTTPGLPIQTWGSSVCDSVTEPLHNNTGCTIQTRGRQNNTCVSGINTIASQKTWKKEEKTFCLWSQISLWKAGPFRNGASWLAGQGSEQEEKPKGRAMPVPFLPLLIYQVDLENLVLRKYTASCGTGSIPQNVILTVILTMQPPEPLVLKQLHRGRRCDAQTSTSESLLFLMVISNFVREKMDHLVSGPLVGIGTISGTRQLCSSDETEYQNYKVEAWNWPCWSLQIWSSRDLPGRLAGLLGCYSSVPFLLKTSEPCADSL